jgi:hypothetical protein
VIEIRIITFYLVVLIVLNGVSASQPVVDAWMRGCGVCMWTMIRYTMARLLNHGVYIATFVTSAVSLTAALPCILATCRASFLWFRLAIRHWSK